MWSDRVSYPIPPRLHTLLGFFVGHLVLDSLQKGHFFLVVVVVAVGVVVVVGEGRIG